MAKEHIALLIGILEIPELVSDHIDFEYTNDVTSARSLMQTKSYDAVIVMNDHSVLKVFPHYRTVLIDTTKQNGEVSNGFFGILKRFDNDKVLLLVEQIIKKHSKKYNDEMMILLNIKDSINELKTSNDFLKNSFNEVHSRLGNLDKNQEILSKEFSSFKESRKKAEQFFINTVMEIKNAK